jgi:GAF domain-containing protein
MRAPAGPGHSSSTVYAEWADWIADRLAPLLRSPGRVVERPQPELERQRATESMLPDAPADAHLDRITELTRHVFGVEFAAVSLIDGDLQKNRSVAGSDLASVPRASSMCARTIQGDGPLVIGDLQQDPEFADDSPAPEGRSHVRFYAGYPIESPDGYRVGALCVLGTEPRDPQDVDTGTLADLALLAQKELWASVERATP